MNINYHNLKIGDVGIYESIECIISDYIDPITIEIEGYLIKDVTIDYYYKNWFCKLFKIESFIIREFYKFGRLNISYYNFKTK